MRLPLAIFALAFFGALRTPPANFAMLWLEFEDKRPSADIQA
jgi:hypothetical protein